MDKVTNDYAWSTHQPLLRAAMKLFQPELSVEIGVGDYSTPIMMQAPRYKGIDNDPAWIEYMKDTYNLDIELQELDAGINKGTFRKELTVEQESAIVTYYYQLSKTIENDSASPIMCFVDNFTCCRARAVSHLTPSVEILAFHDSEGVAWYDYDMSPVQGYSLYELRTPRSWTAMYVKNTLPHERLKQYVDHEISVYCKEQGIPTSGFVLVKLQ